MLKQIKQAPQSAAQPLSKPAVLTKPEEQKKNVFYQDHEEDDIREDIELEEDNQMLRVQEVEAGIAASTSLGIDQSIDTLRLEEYDYIEEVKFY